MKITIENAFSQVHCSFETRTILRQVLSYEVEGSVFARQSVPYWDGRVRLMDKNGRFPTGLLFALMRYLKKEGVRYELVDHRKKPESEVSLPIALPSDKPPRYYQLECAGMTDHRPRGVFVMGTGAGKTLTAGLITAKRGVPTLFVTPDTGLQEQAQVEFESWFGSRNVGHDVASDKPIIISNIQSLVRKDPKLFQRFKMLLIDEFHHGAAKSYQKLNGWVTNAYHRYGFTGTFVRPDGADMEMHGLLSNVLFTKTTSELIEEGFLVRPEITVLRFELKGCKRLNYKMAYDLISTDEEFAEVVAKIALEKMAEGKQTLILVRRKEHGRLLSERIEGSYYLSGDDPREHRATVKQRFLERKIRGLIATNIFGEGQDIPSIDVLINARCQKTEIQTSQGIGRALRKAPGKEKAEVFDFLVVGQRNLQDHSVERIQTYRRESAFRIKFRRA